MADQTLTLDGSREQKKKAMGWVKEEQGKAARAESRLRKLTTYSRGGGTDNDMQGSEAERALVMLATSMNMWAFKVLVVIDNLQNQANFNAF